MNVESSAASTVTTKAELRPVASGGINPELPEGVIDFADRYEVKSRSARFYVNFANRIAAVRRYIASEYPDGDLSNPNIGLKSGNKRENNWVYEDRGTHQWVEDPDGSYLPHRRDVVILGQELKSDDTVIEGKHWLEGHQYDVDSKGNTVPLGAFIDNGIRGEETVVSFFVLVRQRGHWIPKSESHPVISTPEITVFPGVPLTA